MRTSRSRRRVPARRSSSSIICRTPAPSCIRISVLAAQLVERDRAAGERVPGRAGEDDGVAEERLVLDAAVARRRADDAELEGAVGDALDDGLRVEDAERDVQLRVQLGELGRGACERTTPPGPVEAPISKRAGELAGRVVGELVDDLLLEREQPLGAER